MDLYLGVLYFKVSQVQRCLFKEDLFTSYLTSHIEEKRILENIIHTRTI